MPRCGGFASVSLSLSLCLFLSLSRSHFRSRPHSLSLYIYIYLSLSLFFFFFSLSLSLFLGLARFVPVTVGVNVGLHVHYIFNRSSITRSVFPFDFFCAANIARNVPVCLGAPKQTFWKFLHFLAHHSLKISTNIRIQRCLKHRNPEICKHNTKHKPRKLQCAHKTALSEKTGAIGAMGKKRSEWHATLQTRYYKPSILQEILCLLLFAPV